MKRQFIVAATGSLALAPLVYAQVPPLSLPGLPTPPGATSNLDDHDNAATVNAEANTPPPLNFEVPGPEGIQEEGAKKAAELPNPTDSIPPELLDQMGVTPATADDTPNSDDGGATTAENADESATEADAAENDIANSTDKSADDANESDDISAAKQPAPPPPLNLPAPTDTASASNANPPPPAAATGSKRARRRNTARLPTGLENTATDHASQETDTTGRSWEKQLAPSRRYPKTNYNYRTVELPDTVYREGYDRFNQHLPARRTKQDYDFELLRAAATNDVNGVRALLRQGSNIDQINAQGDSALMLALKSGAADTARLLIVKGANIDRGSLNGGTVFDYARRLSDQGLMQALLKRSANAEKIER